MRKVLLIIGIIVAVLLVGLLIASWAINEDRPTGEQGPAAEAMAEKMLEAINYEAWQNTRFLRWTFPGGHHYTWDKTKGLVQVRWGDTEVLLRTDDVTGKAWRKRELLKGEAAEEAIETAWGYFCNDSFWLNAPAKVFDAGTQRSLVELEDGGKGLLVEYKSGGVTPGDAYLWRLDENGLPKSFEMWVSIIPVGGLEASWEGWTTLATGARLSTAHDLGLFTTEISNLKGGNTLESVWLGIYPFEALGERLAVPQQPKAAQD
ncbi:MAG TPA: hypothetical protein VJ933_06340 [Phaeodactylibacter sp.]|nr:hypothetical protein [Phaeodactylibacter sp.]